MPFEVRRHFGGEIEAENDRKDQAKNNLVRDYLMYLIEKIGRGGCPEAKVDVGSKTS